MKGASSAQKALQRVQDADEGVAGRKSREEYFPDKGLIDLLSWQTNDLSQKGNKIELVARPVCHLLLKPLENFV